MFNKIPTKNINQTIKNMVPSKKRNCCLIISDTVSSLATDGLWEGGSRSILYRGNISGGNLVQVTDTTSGPWSDTRKNQKFTIKSNEFYVKLTIFLGKESNPTYYITEENKHLFNL